MTMERKTIAGMMNTALKTASVAGLTTLVAACVSMPMLGQTQADTKVAAKPVAARTPVVEEEEESTTAPKKPGQEGIKVHGHWVMDLKDKDGKIVGHRDFQNSLDATNGATLLSMLLTGQAVSSTLELEAMQIGQVSNGSVFGSSLGTHTGALNTFEMYPAAYANAAAACTNNGNYCTPGLQVTYIEPKYLSSAYVSFNGGNPSVYGPPQIVVQGQFTTSFATEIDAVASSLNICSTHGAVTNASDPSQAGAGGPLTLSPTQCSAQSNFATGIYSYDIQFTSATLRTPVTMQAGQTLAITLTLSFN